MDYQALNAINLKDRFPIPTVDKLLDDLAGVPIFSKSDLQAGYYQVRIHSKDIEKSVFHTHQGHYEFVVMPFGLSNASSTFQALMNTVFRRTLLRFVLAFFDDILICNPTLTAHIEHLRIVLTLLRSH